MSRGKDGSAAKKYTARKFLRHSPRYALCDVRVRVAIYLDVQLRRAPRVHLEENYLFYVEARLNETLKRHETKFDPRISTDKMKEVYPYASATGHENEVIIPERSSLEQTVEQIVQITGI